MLLNTLKNKKIMKTYLRPGFFLGVLLGGFFNATLLIHLKKKKRKKLHRGCNPCVENH